MNSILEAVYKNWADNYHESYEMSKIYKMLVKPFKGNAEKEDAIYFMYAEAISKENCNAFCAGFYSAVELLVTRGGKM